MQNQWQVEKMYGSSVLHPLPVPHHEDKQEPKALEVFELAQEVVSAAEVVDVPDD